MSDDALELVRLRNNFYRDNYRKLLLALLICLIVIISLVAIVFYIEANLPKPKYFATTADGRILRLIPLDEPNISTAALLQWANVAATSAYTYDFLNYRKELQDAAQYFTQDGYKQYLEALTKSNNLQTVLDEHLYVTAVATGSPVITDQGRLGNRYGWKVQMPILVTYQGASGQVTQSLLVKMLIVRRSTLTTPRGIGIQSFISQPR